MERTLSLTNTCCRKLSTSGAFSARSSRHAGLLARSHAISSKPLTTVVMGQMLGRGYDIPPRCLRSADELASEECQGNQIIPNVRGLLPQLRGSGSPGGACHAGEAERAGGEGLR